MVSINLEDNPPTNVKDRAEWDKREIKSEN